MSPYISHDVLHENKNLPFLIKCRKLWNMYEQLFFFFSNICINALIYYNFWRVNHHIGQMIMWLMITFAVGWQCLVTMENHSRGVFHPYTHPYTVLMSLLAWKHMRLWGMRLCVDLFPCSFVPQKWHFEFKTTSFAVKERNLDEEMDIMCQFSTNVV